MKNLSPDTWAAIGIGIVLTSLFIHSAFKLEKEKRKRHGYTDRVKGREDRLGRREQ
jgi:hypothetical protein